MATYTVIHENSKSEIEDGHKIIYRRRVEQFELSGKLYQRETFYRNGQRLNSHSYPANTDYALDRLA
jgi:hypothetical protein